jgi:hypothetical protein
MQDSSDKTSNIDKSYLWNPSVKDDFVPITLLCSKPIELPKECLKVINYERSKIIGILIITSVLSPLIIRYGMGSGNPKIEETREVIWGSGIDNVEYFILFVVYIGIVSTILKLLPIVCGRPSCVESTKECNLTGKASLGLCSPFAFEDEVVFLRSLIGRTSTIFNTIRGRHEIEGLYVDAILNERRVNMDDERKYHWIAWMKFLHRLIEICRDNVVNNSITIPPIQRRNSNKTTQDKERLRCYVEGNDVTSNNLVNSDTNYIITNNKQIYDTKVIMKKFSTFAEMSLSINKERKTEILYYNNQETLLNATYVEIELDTINTMIEFIDGWLQELKRSEWSYKYDNKMYVYAICYNYYYYYFYYTCIISTTNYILLLRLSSSSSISVISLVNVIITVITNIATNILFIGNHLRNYSLLHLLSISLIMMQSYKYMMHWTHSTMNGFSHIQMVMTEI